jgi:leucyl-tRNA synthetase
VPTQEPFKKLINQGMIQGESAFIYKLVLSNGFWGSTEDLKDFKEFPEQLIPTVFLTKKIYTLLNSNGKEEIEILLNEWARKVVDETRKNNASIDFNGGLTAHSIFAIPERINVKLVGDGNKVDVERLIEEKRFNKNFFILDVDVFEDRMSSFEIKEVNEYKAYREVEKMSKSKHNVVNPDDVIAEYGADTFRMFEMFLGPIETHKPWNTEGIGGVFKFLRKFWNLFHNEADEFIVSNDAPTEKEMKVLHTCIKKVNEDIERFSFNTCVSAFMICVNELTDLKCNKRTVLEELVKLLSPFAPHTAEELWEKLGNQNSVVKDIEYPEFEAKYLVESSVNYPVSINGKVRAKIDLPAGINQDEAKAQVVVHELIEKWLEGKEPKKFIFVPGRIINIVI